MATKALALEDKDLSSNITVTRNTTFYSDIDLSFTPKLSNRPSSDNIIVRRVIYKKTDLDSVKQSISTILRSNNFEKPFEPYFGANITGMLFELANDTTHSEIEGQIEDAIEAYEPRVQILNLTVDLKRDQNSCFVRMVFKILNTGTTEIIETTLSRLR